jgi:hypothetical protein
MPYAKRALSRVLMRADSVESAAVLGGRFVGR